MTVLASDNSTRGDPGILFQKVATVLADFVEGFAKNLSNETDGHAETHAEHSSAHDPTLLLFLFVAFTLGALVRQLLKKTPIPYTVILICLGLIIGAVSNAVPILKDYTTLAKIDPHLMLYIFLPILIFESAFAMDVHTFKKTVGQSLILAGPGMVLSAVLTAIMARYIFQYNWSWVVSLLFGTILSATDPVAVVALLKELGAPVQLGIVIEGESLLNDGAAIVLFEVLKTELLPGTAQTGLSIFVYFLRVVVGGPLFGWVMGKLTILWLSNVFNDALIEITITLASTYITFYIGESFLKVSGVLAVVTLGIEISSRRSNISPEVEKFLHRFWEMLGYLANTLIFVLVGVVIAQQAFSGVEGLSWMYLVVLYLTLIIIRLIIVSAATPILSRIGYSMKWQHAVVISWGGLRGAVGLALALVVVQEGNSYPGTVLQSIGNHFLFYTAGIVILTLLVNASTTEYLLKFLGMSEISHAKKLAMAQAVKRVQEAQLRAMSMLKSDHFLADANWPMVEKSTFVDDPYRDTEEEIPKNALIMKATHCPQCDATVPRIPHPRELAEIAEEARIRTIKAEKTSYWRQFEQGMLGRDAVLVLNSIADTAMDTPERLITKKDIEGNWRIPKLLKVLRSYIEQVYNWKATDLPPAPTKSCLYYPYKIATNNYVDGCIMGVIGINMVLTIVELIIVDTTALFALQIVNYFFVVFYVAEVNVKMLGLRKYYWFSKWNIFDFAITILSILDTTVVDIAVPTVKGVNPGLFRILSVFRILRIIRAGRLLKVLMYLLLTFVDHIINRRLRFGYDIGKGFVVAKEEMLLQLDKLDFAHKEVVKDLKMRSEVIRLEVIKSLGLLRKEHPGVAQSVKTHQAIRSVLNHCDDTVRKMLGSGILDQSDADKLFLVLEVKMKRLNRTPATLPLPNPEEILRNLPWLDGLENEIIDGVVQCATLIQFEHGDSIQKRGEDATAIYIIVSGLVKIFEEIGPFSDETASTSENSLSSLSVKENVLDLYASGNVLGEGGLLRQEAITVSASCETDVQAFMIMNSELEEILERYPIVKEGLWRVYGIRVAHDMLLDQPEYQDWTRTKISLLCEDSFVVYPPSGPAPTFEITDQLEAVIVLSGKARCMSTRERLVAPCLVPKNVDRLLMDGTDTILLVIPKLGKAAGQRKSDLGKLHEDPKVKQYQKPYLRMLHLMRMVLGNCCKRRHRSAKIEPEDPENGENKDHPARPSNLDENLENMPNTSLQAAKGTALVTVEEQLSKVTYQEDKKDLVDSSDEVKSSSFDLSTTTGPPGTPIRN